MTIKGERIYFRNLTEKDATKRYCEWLNDPEVNRHLDTKSATTAELKEYINKKNKDPNCLFLGIFFKENNQHIGNIKLEIFDFKKKKAFLGLLIGDKNYWGKGIGTEATRLLVDYCFYKLNLNEAEVGMTLENTASIKIHEKLGFKVTKNQNGSILMSVKKESWQVKSNCKPACRQAGKIKLVIWDADETLWNGSVYYQDKEAVVIKPGTKAALKELDKRGIIIAMCSKNNYEDVDLMLKKLEIDKYFKELQVGWGLKSEAIKKLALMFGVSFSEILFIDDEPFQRAEVVSQIPDINAVELADPIDVLNIEGIRPENETEEDKKRVQILKEDRSRDQAQKDHRGGYKDFLHQCDIKMLVRDITEQDWPRVAQLLNRTNELNATGNRYQLDELKRSYEVNKDKIFVSELKDKFGDYGLIAETIIDTRTPDIWFIRDLTVSCRTMGRGIGSALVLSILQLAKKNGVKKVQGYLVKNESNWRMQSLYEKRGFKKIFDDGKIKRYEFDISSEVLNYPAWIQVVMEA